MHAGDDDPVERNTLAAAVCFAAAVVSDAFVAVDRADGVEAPAALRTTAMVLIGCLASPPIRESYAWRQRFLLGTSTVAVALAGSNEAAARTRLADSVYTSVALATLVYLFPQPHKGRLGRGRARPFFLRREAVGNAAVATLLYASVRALRRGALHAYVASTHLVAVRTYASVVTGPALVIGGVAGVVLATTLFFDPEYRLYGTGAVGTSLFVGAVAQLTAAFVATMAYSEQVANLYHLHSDSACDHPTECPAARASRRLAVVNTSAADLWLAGLGTMLMAYVPSRRVRSHEQTAVVVERTTLVACLVCVAALWVYLPLSSLHWLFAIGESARITDAAALLGLVAVATAWCWDALAGAVLFVAAVALDMGYVVWAYGFASVFSQLTWVLNAGIVVLLVLHVVAVFGAEAAFACGIEEHRLHVPDAIARVTAVASTSLALLLYCGTCALQVTYDGALVPEAQYRFGGPERYARTTAALILEHWMPLLVCASLYWTRSEVDGARDRRLRVAVWYVSASALVVAWAVMLYYGMQSTVADAYGVAFSPTFYWAAVVMGVVPWAAAVWV